MSKKGILAILIIALGLELVIIKALYHKAKYIKVTIAE
jgi:hypothetical protein